MIFLFVAGFLFVGGVTIKLVLVVLGGILDLVGLLIIGLTNIFVAAVYEVRRAFGRSAQKSLQKVYKVDVIDGKEVSK